MAYYALLDSNNVVTQVIAGKSELTANWEAYYGSKFGQTCKRTSYNTRAGVHVEGGTPFRKNYAGIGYTYDEGRDAFIPPKPYNSWVLNEDSCTWDAPVAVPTEPLEEGQFYTWDEETTNWIIGGRFGLEKPKSFLENIKNFFK